MMLKLMPAVRDTQRDSDEIRRCALDRLYRRKAAVDELIESLENYVRMQSERRLAPCIPISEGPRWS